MDYAINHTFPFFANNKSYVLKVVATSDFCKGCFFAQKEGKTTFCRNYSRNTITGQCKRTERSDGNNVIFKPIKTY